MASYKVAPLFNPNKDPETFDDYEDAEIKAIENSIDDDAWGVWDEETDHLEAIAYQSTAYSQ